MFISDQQRKDLLKGIFTSYYQSLGAKEVIFDTNRLWCTKLPALSILFPEARVICCVRSINWIIDSLEHLARKNAFELSGMFGFDGGSTVYTRVNAISKSTGLVGYALDTLRKMYNFVGELYFNHDFNNVVYEADNFDLQLGARGLHTIRRKVEWIEHPTILPADIFNRFQNDMFWRTQAAQNKRS